MFESDDNSFFFSHSTSNLIKLLLLQFINTTTINILFVIINFCSCTLNT